ncbi:MAG TPA: hypothetical protein VKA13_00415 [Gammaproteobacteria bacterium]|nr:hypothetical protein [Gammaproteobacteria bacterium]
MLKRFVAVMLFAAALAGCANPNTEWVPGWQEMTSMNKARAGAAVIEVNGVIYAIGGVDGNDFQRTAEYSRIKIDGTLAPWQLTSPINEKRGFFAVAYHRGYLYIVGGGNGPSGHHLLRSVERARVTPGGDLGKWEKEQNLLNFPRRCAELVVVGDEMYAIGGFSGVLQDTIERATIRDDGHVGPWSLVKNKLTMPRYIHGLRKNSKGIYVIGGHSDSGGNGQDKVEWRPVHDANAPWRLTASMNTGRYALATAAHRGYMYALGGLNGPTYLQTVEKAQVATDGSLKPWVATTKLSSPRANLGTVVYKNWMYVIGGTNYSNYFKSVERAVFNDQGDMGFWASPKEAAAYRKRQQARQKASALTMPNKAVATQVIQAGAYSYVKVDNGYQSLWLAGPRVDLHKGDHLRYSRGVVMGDFYSKLLKRHFDAVTFVEGMEKASDQD